MKTDNINKIKRYPGVYSFTHEQKNIFFGRDNDIEKLLTLIKVENQVLLYSKSGIGKTSLLNAGIIPKLPKNIEIINIRFFAYNEKIPPTQRIINILKNKYSDIFKNQDTIIDKLIKNTENNKILWYYLKKLQLSKSTKIFLFVFDQFEELFSYPKTEIIQFKNQLHDLINNKIPETYSNLIETKIETEPDFFDNESFKILHKSPDIKNVFAIRSDRLSLLNQLIV